MHNFELRFYKVNLFILGRDETRSCEGQRTDWPALFGQWATTLGGGALSSRDPGSFTTPSPPTDIDLLKLLIQNRGINGQSFLHP